MIQILATRPQYEAHLRPVAEALGSRARLVSTLSPAPGPVVVASTDDHAKARGPRDDRRDVIVMEHGIGQSYSNGHNGYPGGVGREASLYLTPNAHSATRWRYAYPGADVEVVGSPVLDLLPAREPGPPTVAISFHWPCTVETEAGTAFPDFVDELERLARRFNVIGHAHPWWRIRGGDRPRHAFKAAGIEYVESFEEVCRRADVYVCDNSSTLYEFASTGRPVVVMNSSKYRRDVDHGLRFWSAATVGIQVDAPGDLADAVAEAIGDAPARRSARNAALDIVYAYRHGAARRAADAILERFGAAAAA